MCEIVLRRARRGDEEGVQRVVETVWHEYGFVWDPDYYNRDLTDLKQHYFDVGGDFWVLEQEGKIVGTGGYEKHSDEECELARLYLLKEVRGKGWGRRLFEHIVRTAQERGFNRMVIWSDKKLVEAHRLYTSYGAKLFGDRWVRDADLYEEWGFVLDLTNVSLASER